MELTFRTAGIGDLELLTESRLRAIRTYRHLSETAPLPQELPDAVRDYYRQALASGGHIAFLALAGERLAATGGLDLRREMPSYHNPAGLSGHIMNIWTEPAFRGRGIAWRMLDLLTAAARERGCLTVSLHATAMGRPLYQRYGFTATDDEMELELPAAAQAPLAAGEPAGRMAFYLGEQRVGETALLWAGSARDDRAGARPWYGWLEDLWLGLA